MPIFCHLLKTFHKKGVGCFLDIKDLYITSNNVVKLNSLFSCFSVSSWDEVSTTTKDSYAKLSDDNVRALGLDRLRFRFGARLGAILEKTAERRG